MPVPEAAVDEDYGPMSWKYKIGFTRQTLVVEDVAKSFCVKASPDNHFRLGILAPDACHHPASDFGRNDVSHRQKPVQAL